MQIVGREGLHKWLTSANTASPFLGARPLDFLLRGQVGNLLDTHRYLKRFASGSF